VSIQPYILGKGRAGLAIEKALLLLKTMDPELEIGSVKWLTRDNNFSSLPENSKSVLFIANPNALHADSISKAQRAGFASVVCEKPACISLEQVKELKALNIKGAVFHIYRQMWGPQMIRKMIDGGELGELISIEGRYWHASMAQRALEISSGQSTAQNFHAGWKNDKVLSGPYDTLLDLGTHWLDMTVFFMKDAPLKSDIWRSFVNSEKEHRDTHLHFQTTFPRDRRTFASLSKTIHGSSDHFEINVIGTKKSAFWNLLNNDEISVGEGRSKKTMNRTESSHGGRMPPFRGLGWLEGYIEVIRQHFRDLVTQKSEAYPTLKEALSQLEHIFSHIQGPPQ
jgi:predicted dehydrogenase